MRILVISDLYPPYYIGGYELGCHDVVEGLKARGHEVKVRTSTYGIGKAQNDGDIYRWLKADVEQRPCSRGAYGGSFLHKEWINQSAFRKTNDPFRRK